MDTVSQREMVNFQLKAGRLVYVGLEDTNIKIIKMNGCIIQGRGSGLQKPDKETTRITQDTQRGKEGQTHRQVQMQT